MVDAPKVFAISNVTMDLLMQEVEILRQQSIVLVIPLQPVAVPIAQTAMIKKHRLGVTTLFYQLVIGLILSVVLLSENGSTK